MSVDETPEHLRATQNGRGSTCMPKIQGRNGDLVQVYDSRSMGVPYVWIKLDKGNGAPVHVRMSIETAWQLSEQIQGLVESQHRDTAPETVRRQVALKHREELVDEHCPQ